MIEHLFICMKLIINPIVSLSKFYSTMKNVIKAIATLLLLVIGLSVQAQTTKSNEMAKDDKMVKDDKMMKDDKMKGSKKKKSSKMKKSDKMMKDDKMQKSAS